jgi:chromosomal replication initiation ATPase DnaA
MSSQFGTTQFRPNVAAKVISEACAAEGVWPASVVRGCRARRVVAARRRAIRKLRDLGYSLPKIGRMLGGLHHTSVAYHLAGYEPYSPDTPDLSGEWAI